jgi:hypothetical protein
MLVENVRGSEGEILVSHLNHWQSTDCVGTDQYTLDSSGFEYHNVPTKLTTEEFADDEKIKSVYYEEQSNILKEITGASKVILFDHSESIIKFLVTEPF